MWVSNRKRVREFNTTNEMLWNWPEWPQHICLERAKAILDFENRAKHKQKQTQNTINSDSNLENFGAI